MRSMMRGEAKQLAAIEEGSQFCNVAAAVIGTVVSAGVAANASSKAAKAQRAAAGDASAAELEMFDKSVELQKPFMERADRAGNRLEYLLGLGGDGRKTREQLMAELRPQFTKTAAGGAMPGGAGGMWAGGYPMTGAGYQPGPGVGVSVDEAALKAAVDKAYAAQQAQAKDPEFGSLLRNFSMADLNADPVYQSGLQFGLNEGTKALNNRFAASGGFQSGAALKALTRFANDYGSTKANESYNRFNNNTTNKFNRLASLANVGQQAASQVGGQAVQVGQSIGNNLIGAGNARASGYIGGANALTGAVGQGWNMYQSNRMMNQMYPQQYGVAQQPGVTDWVSQG